MCSLCVTYLLYLYLPFTALQHVSTARLKIIHIAAAKLFWAVASWLRQSEGTAFKYQYGQIAYFHGVKTRLSTLGTADAPRGSDST